MTLLAKSAQGKGGPDAIFAYSDMANKRAREIGRENITNATLGTFLNAEGRVLTLKTVEESMRGLDFAESVNYAPLKGLPEYTKAVIDAAFGEYRPQGHIAAIATPGGTGALHNAFYNYLNPGETAITTNYCWGNYRTMLREMECSLETFTTFEDDHFNVKACLSKVAEIAARQQTVFLILNTPAHNPTGYSVSDDEWDEIIAGLCKVTENGKNNVVLVVDVAYIDFAGKDGRKFLQKFSNLPQNFLTLVAFSLSKGYTLYGYRLGALIAVSSDADVIAEFEQATAASSRATWSNCNKAAMMVMCDFAANPQKQAAFKAEQSELSQTLVRRAEIFNSEAKECGLVTLPYKAGFFVMVPTVSVEAAKEAAAILREQDIFLVPLGQGLRVALCAIVEEKVKGLAFKINDAVKKAQGDCR